MSELSAELLVTILDALQTEWNYSPNKKIYSKLEKIVQEIEKETKLDDQKFYLVEILSGGDDDEPKRKTRTKK